MSREKVMTCFPISEALFRRIGDFAYQPKYNGIRCRIVCRPFSKEVELRSSSDRIITSLPHINDAARAFMARTSFAGELDSELWSPDLSFEEIQGSAARNAPTECSEVSAYIFDILPADSHLNLQRRLSVLSFYDKTLQPPLIRVPTFVRTDLINDLRSMTKIAKRFQQLGYEGLVMKDLNSFYEPIRSRSWLKLKPDNYDTYRIIGWKEEVDKNGRPKGTLGALHVIDSANETFWVGSGLSKQQRQELWEMKPFNLWVKVRYYGLTGARSVPRHPIFMEILNDPPMEGE